MTQAMQTESTTDWVQLLPVVLAKLRMTPYKDVHLSPEIIFGCPFPTPGRKGGPAIGTTDLDVLPAEYSAALLKPIDQQNEFLKCKQPEMLKGSTHLFQAGYKVMVKSLRPINMGEGKYKGPAELVAIT